MTDCCKIIRLLKEVKRKADTSFCEINTKIEHLESKYNILSLQNDQLKKDVDEQKSKMAQLNTQAATVAPSTIVQRVRARRNMSKLRKLSSKSAKSSRVSVRSKKRSKSACRPKKRQMSTKRSRGAKTRKRGHVSLKAMKC